MGKPRKRQADSREETIQKALKAIENGLEGGVAAAAE